MNRPVYLGPSILELSIILMYEFRYVETRFGTPNYELDRPKGKDKKATRSIKNELGIKIMIHFVGLRAKTYSYLINESSED